MWCAIVCRVRGGVNTCVQMVHEGTEGIFNDEFYAGLSFVTNALDNVKVCAAVDAQRCCAS